MSSDISIVANVRVVEVGHFLLSTCAIRRRRVDGRKGGHVEKLEVVTNADVGLGYIRGSKLD